MLAQAKYKSNRAHSLHSFKLENLSAWHHFIMWSCHHVISTSCHLLETVDNFCQLLACHHSTTLSAWHHVILSSCSFVILSVWQLVNLLACQLLSLSASPHLGACLLDLIQSYLYLIVWEIEITKVCNWGQFNLCCIYMYYIWHVFLFVLPFVFHFTVFVFVGGRSDLCFQQHGSSESRGAWSVDSKLWAF